MALAIDTAEIRFNAYPAGTVSATVRYRVADQATPDLARSGTISLELPEPLRRQLATIIEDGLRAAGKL